MATFALVHGAWHDARCWDALVAVLRSRGHDTVTVDLPGDDPTATFEDYAEVVIRSLGGVADEVILVGHSLAGHTIPLVAAQASMRHLVFLCGLIAGPGVSFVDQLAAEPDMLSAGYTAGLSEPDEHGRRQWVDRSLATEILYADCDPDDARRAFDSLRPQSSAPYSLACPLEAMPSTERTYIVCSEDRLVDPSWSRQASITRLGVEPVELPGGHSPFLSRPEALADVLQRLA